MTAEHRRAARPVFVSFASFGLAWGAWGAALPAVQARAGLSDRELGLALLAVAAGALPAMRAAPWLLARWPRVALPGLTTALLAAFAVAVAATDAVGLIAALALVGVVSGAHDVAMNSVGSALERQQARSLLQLAHATFSLAVVGGGITIGTARQLGVPAPAAVGALASITVVAAVLAWRSAPDITVRAEPRARSKTAVGGGRLLLLLGAVALVASLVENAMQSWSALHLERSLEAPPLFGGLAAAAFALGAAAGRLGAHRYAAERPLRLVLGTAAAAGAAALVVAATATRPVVALAAIGLAGAAISTVLPAVISAAGRGDPDRPAAAIARVATMGYVGFLVGPPLVGTFAEATSLRTAFAALAGVVVLIAVFGALHRSDDLQDRTEPTSADLTRRGASATDG